MHQYQPTHKPAPGNCVSVIRPFPTSTVFFAAAQAGSASSKCTPATTPHPVHQPPAQLLRQLQRLGLHHHQPLVSLHNHHHAPPRSHGFHFRFGRPNTA